MNIGRYPSRSLSQFLNPVRYFIRKIRAIFMELCEVNAQQCKSLANVVVKLSRDPRPFLLLRFNQLSGHAQQSLFGSLQIGNISDHADHPQQFPFAVEEGTPGGP
jgi:hypothetical protein